MNNELILLNTDRIIKINNFNLPVHEDYRPFRRNVICYSNILQEHIILNNLSNRNSDHISEICRLMSNKALINDIKVIEVEYG